MTESLEMGKSIDFNVQTFDFKSAQFYLDRAYANAPFIHCLTNNTTKFFVANALLAIGAKPAMVESWQEVVEFSQRAANVVMNLDSLTDERLRSLSMSAQVAHDHGKWWVFDPAAVSDILSYRSGFARELLRYYPRVIRGNASEISYLNDTYGRRSFENVMSSSEAIEAAVKLAIHQRAVVVVTGEIDYVTDGETILAVRGGHPFLGRVCGTGCVLSAMIASTVLCGDVLYGAASACALMKRAGERAGLTTSGLGSFYVALLDNLTFPMRYQD
ncbi:hydroxyethylthiazole kinase [Dichelobacter nodosus]|uniref:Hydroxyethylthiazole kinase n=1 Tax=Dichelobacter nodosus (strain VCS1703A) TaxID=246195 RepID=THIM_DICNV|nr:hydroxyethylthiazole kinase [Dichelobacter nodosus]A5EY60.1 RecName: Full=Hydroxyethylthiazole kinase; AltName: Full=4-methyl-5-beta-hydroxyethylthiazole kinase; Short=TH kinase; Short=Thz kinase [Dichelobacter nodosus VCS1703A]ABQ13771.1 hydroxyethylthiazole kinase [Dichelobacter nodosus VCS1703A]